METVCVGIDTGGTFTDLVAVELERGRHHYHKVPTLTAEPAKGILDGIVELLDRNGLDRAAVKLLCWARRWRPTPCCKAGGHAPG